MKIHHIILIAVALIVLAVALYPLQIYEDNTYICENTASYKGYREWFFGKRTGQWYIKSAIEKFMEKEDPNALVYRWSYYSGAGMNVYGKPVRFMDGLPGAVTHLSHRELNLWVQHNKPEDIRRLYDLLVSDDQEKIWKKADQIWEEYWRFEEK